LLKSNGRRHDAEISHRLDQSLLQSLHALLTSSSVSAAATKVGLTQPAMSRHLKALRDLTGDVLLVRVGNRMVLTPSAQSLAAPVRRILNDLSLLYQVGASFEPAAAQCSFRMASYDFLPASFFAGLVERVTQASPGSALEIRGLADRIESLRQLNEGEVDVAVSIRPDVPGHLHAKQLLSDRVVCVVRKGHALARKPTAEVYRAAAHVAGLEQSPGAGDGMDSLLARAGMAPRTMVRTQYLSIIPQMLTQTDLVLTTGHTLAGAMARQWPLEVLPFPIPIEPLRFQLIWHERTHKNQAVAWLRAQIVAAARQLTA